MTHYPLPRYNSYGYGVLTRGSETAFGIVGR